MKTFILLLSYLSLLLSTQAFAGSHSVAILRGSGGATSGLIGDSTIQATDQSMGTNYVYLYRCQATKTGSFSNAFIYDNASHTDANIKICIYNAANTLPAQAADTDTLVGCSGVINSNNAAEWLSSSISGSAVSGNWYWIMALTNTSGQGWTLKRSTTSTLYYKASAGLYDSPPADLDGITFSNGALAPFSAYVVIP